MAGRKPFTVVAAALFAVMALLHVDRLVTHFQVIVGNHVLPQGVSWIAAVVLALLAVMLFK